MKLKVYKECIKLPGLIGLDSCLNRYGKFLKIIKLVLLCGLLFFASPALAKKKRASARRTQMQAYIQLRMALRYAKTKSHAAATRQFYLLLNNPILKKQKNKIRYHLASSLYQMGLYHPAVVQLQILINQKDKTYTGPGLRKVATAAAMLKDDGLLDYAIQKGGFKYISRSDRQKLYYQFGEYWMRKRKFRKAIAHFSRVQTSNPLFYQALYQMGLAHAERNDTEKAVVIFGSLESRRQGITDKLKVAAVMGKARAYYQGKQWGKAVESYLEVPKDSSFWHATLLERSWALLRGGRLRSALSNFQTLHSEYYTDYYQPESLLLRSIIYLYICKYYEMEKVLDLFNRIYRPVFQSVKNLLKRRYASKAYYQSLLLSLDNKKKGVYVKYPLPVARRIFAHGDIFAIHYHINKLKEERSKVHGLPSVWRRSRVGRYVAKVIGKKLRAAYKKAGKLAFSRATQTYKELKDFFVQEQYIRYEMLRSKRGFLKKKIARKSISSRASIENFDRSYYVQNGYEYWPFKGEYWLDELGNYHYVGMGSCKK